MTMTTDEMIEVLQAYKEGKTIEVYCSDYTWKAIQPPSWDFSSFTYRGKKETWSIGQQIQFLHSPEQAFIIASLGKNLLTLINLNTGIRWSDSVSVDDIHCITEDEMSSLTRGYPFKTLEKDSY